MAGRGMGELETSALGRKCGARRVGAARSAFAARGNGLPPGASLMDRRGEPAADARQAVETRTELEPVRAAARLRRRSPIGPPRR